MHRWTGLLARLIVGGVWVYAGLAALPHPLALVEILIGVCLLAGLQTRLGGFLSALLQIAFVIGIGSVWSHGIELDCGCFGDGSTDPEALGKYPWEVSGSLGLVALSVYLVVRPATAFALDAALFGPRPGRLRQQDRPRAESQA